MVRFLVCLCMLGGNTGLALYSLCVLLFALIFIGEDIVANF